MTASSTNKATDAAGDMTSDEELMRAFQRGGAPQGRAAFSELFSRYRAPVFGFFRRRLADRSRAEELAQEVFVALLNNAARYEPRAAFRSYLYGIAFNVLKAERRKLAHSPRRLDDPALPDTLADPSADGVSPPERLAAVMDVRAALARLDEPHREVLLLREYERLSYSEIAGALGIPENTVRSQLFRARAALRSLLTATPGAPSGDAAGNSANTARAGKEGL